MPISVECSGCGKQYRVSEQAAGKKLRCRNCGRDMLVPEPSAGSRNRDPFEALVAMERNGRSRGAAPVAQAVIFAEAAGR